MVLSTKNKISSLFSKNIIIYFNSKDFFLTFFKKKIFISFFKFFFLNNRFIPIFKDFSLSNFNMFFLKQQENFLGYSFGFCNKLILSGLGFKFLKFKNILFIKVGISPFSRIVIPHSVLIFLKKKNEIEISSVNIDLLFKISAQILGLLKINPYTLKGIIHYKQHLKKKTSSKLAAL